MNPTLPESGADRGATIGADPGRPAVLLLTHRVPYPPDKGDRIRTFHLLKALSRRSAVHLACLADEPPEERAIAALRPYCTRLTVIRLGSRMRWVRAVGALALGRTVTEGAFRSPALRSALRRWIQEVRFHAAVASASSLAPYLRMVPFEGVPALIDLVDVDSQKWLDYAGTCRGPRSWLYRIEGRRLRCLERSLLGWARAVTLVSEAEADLCRRCCGDGPIVAITNGVDLDYFRPRTGVEERSCVFVGALDYFPNVEGIRWFCDEVWPDIHRRQPQSTITLVGRRPAAVIRRLAGRPGVELVGQVPDVRPYLARAAVVVVPLQIARGVQNKVLEALAMGKAVVASPQALEGLHVQPDVHLLSASSPASWVGAVMQLLGDPGLRRRLGVAGRQYVLDHHQWDRCLEPLAGLLGLTPGPKPCGSQDPELAACGE